MVAAAHRAGGRPRADGMGNDGGPNLLWTCCPRVAKGGRACSSAVDRSHAIAVVRTRAKRSPMRTRLLAVIAAALLAVLRSATSLAAAADAGLTDPDAGARTDMRDAAPAQPSDAGA